MTMAIRIWPETNRMKNVRAPILGMRNVVPTMKKALMTPAMCR